MHERVCRDAGIRHHFAEVSATHPAREIVHDESWRFNIVVKYENNKDGELIYAVASRITWICPMTFDSFPLDVQVNHVFSKS